MSFFELKVIDLLLIIVLLCLVLSAAGLVAIVFLALTGAVA